MNFKLKLAALAAIAALTSPAFADINNIGDYTTVAAGDMPTEGGAVLAADAAIGSTVFADATLDGAGNYAVVFQAGANDIAYVEQSADATGNYAYISQISDDAKFDGASVFQSGTGNRAVINQQ